MRRRIVCILAMAIAVAFCYLKSFDVAPTHASLSGWTDTLENNWVAETFVADFDSAAEVNFFVGDVGTGNFPYFVTPPVRPTVRRTAIRQSEQSCRRLQQWLPGEPA
jgi:hypothetical protein